MSQRQDHHNTVDNRGFKLCIGIHGTMGQANESLEGRTLLGFDFRGVIGDHFAHIFSDWKLWQQLIYATDYNAHRDRSLISHRAYQADSIWIRGRIYGLNW